MANTVTDPHGGPVYLTLTGHGERVEVLIRAGAVPMPVFTLGRTTEADYQRQLDTLTTSPWVELHGPDTIMTLTRDGALRYRSEDHAALLRLVGTIIDSHARISGLDGSRPVHRRKAGPYHFTEVSKVPTGVGAYATHGYNGFPRAYLDRATTVEGLRTRGWGLYHELGHLHQQMAYKPGGMTEVTVNIYSLAAQRTLKQPSNLLTVDPATGLTAFQTSRAKFGTAGLTYEKSFGAYEKLVPLRQLELAFGDDFWPRLHKLVREENPQSDSTENDKRYRALATYSSRVAGHDLTDFFVKTWAFPIDAVGRAELAALHLPQPPSTRARSPAERREHSGHSGRTGQGVIVQLSRRTLLAASGATAVGAALAPTAGAAQAAAPEQAAGTAPDTRPIADQDFDGPLLRAETLITGGGFDPSDPDFAAALAALDSAAKELWDTLDRSAGRTALWADLSPVTDPGNFGQSYTRLRTLATAWATPGASLAGDAATADALLGALRFTYDTAYHPQAGESGNWWFWEIGAPRALMDCCVLLRGLLSGGDLTDYLGVVDRFCPDADRRTNSPTLSETGANRTDKAVIVALRGLLGRDGDKLASARDALSDVRDSGRNSLFRYTSSGDGFYEDGSFVQHDVVAYTGSYGTVLLGGAAWLISLLADSPWAVADPKVSAMYEAVERSFAPVVFDGLMMDAVRGRAVSRERAGDHRDGAAAVAAILLLASGAPASYADRWRQLAKGWLTRNRTTPFAALATLPQLALAKAVLNDRDIRTGARTTGSFVLADMDRVVHRRPGWAFALSLSSKRISAYEAGNGENLHGWYTGDGMTYLYVGDGLGQFNDGFWPTVDPYRLPGTTVDTHAARRSRHRRRYVHLPAVEHRRGRGRAGQPVHGGRDGGDRRPGQHASGQEVVVPAGQRGGLARRGHHRERRPGGRDDRREPRPRRAGPQPATGRRCSAARGAGPGR